MPTYLVPGGKVTVDAQGNSVFYVEVNGAWTAAGRYVPGRPDISTIPDPMAAGGIVYEQANRIGSGGGGGGATGGAGGGGGTSGSGGGATGASATDEFIRWMYEAGMLSSEEYRRMQEEAQAEDEEWRAEQERRYQEEKERQERLEREARERQQYFNVQESIRAGLEEAERGLPLGAPKTVSTAMMRWANQLASGFNAPMEVKPDIGTFLRYITQKGWPSGGA